MSKNSVFCIAASRNEADQNVGRLKSANISNAEISVPLAVGKSFLESPHKAPASSPQVAVAGVGTGALVGGGLGLDRRHGRPSRHPVRPWLRLMRPPANRLVGGAVNVNRPQQSIIKNPKT